MKLLNIYYLGSLYQLIRTLKFMTKGTPTLPIYGNNMLLDILNEYKLTLEMVNLEKEITTLKSLIKFRMEEYEEKYKDRYFEMENEELKLYEEKINHFYLVLEMVRKLLGLAPKEGLELYVYIYRNIDEQIFNEYYLEIPYSLREYLNAVKQFLRSLNS